MGVCGSSKPLILVKGLVEWPTAPFIPLKFAIFLLIKEHLSFVWCFLLFFSFFLYCPQSITDENCQRSVASLASRWERAVGVKDKG